MVSSPPSQQEIGDAWHQIKTRCCSPGKPAAKVHNLFDPGLRRRNALVPVTDVVDGAKTWPERKTDGIKSETGHHQC
ncbi:hypothetical protein B296_00053597 [Ensete ventricosum]|uniref:Uncharacterized protein n=1 Tax=Ensete ventricosum TaxID=4639 RepID=A0A426Y7F4_ENSVE|nr:hypothetical protein B296_00053597 [Ensete ventricosum]